MGYAYSARRDLVLGMNWLKQWNALIHCARGTIELSSPDGDRFEVTVAPPTSNKPAVYMINGKFVGDHIKIVREFLDVFPEELPRMPLDREMEFVIDLLPGTAPISKRPYVMSVEELKELKKQLIELQEVGTFVRVPHLGEHWFYLYRRRMVHKGCVLIIDHLMMSQLRISILYLVLKIYLIT